MKRKIAAILRLISPAMRLVAEDEEETLRRLASYRAVTDEFIAKAGGRIFNTAGDAVLAEFPSASKRCAARSTSRKACAPLISSSGRPRTHGRYRQAEFACP